MKSNYEVLKEVLEKNWEGVLKDYLSVRNNFIPWHEERLNQNKEWKVFLIFEWVTGKRIEHNANKVPFTTKLIEDTLPVHGVVGFSRLAPNSIIPYHTGIAGINRVHLGLIIPEGDAGIKVENDVLRWEEGKCIVFDDSKMHTAWNKTNGERVVLIVDI